MIIIHIITSLNSGGAEKNLVKLIKHDNFNKHSVITLSSSTNKELNKILFKLDTSVYCFNLNKNLYSISNIYKFLLLINFLKKKKPDLIQTWLILGDLVGGIAARLAGIKKIIWNVRYSFLEIKYEKIRNILIIKTLAILSYIIPEYIIVVSKSAKYYCENLGYCKKKLHLIRNGYELNQFYPSKIKRVAFRKKFKIKKKIPLIGYVARFHPQKNHTYLLNALSQLNSKNVDFFCVLAGSQINKKNKELILQINKLNLSNKIILLDHYKNIPQLMNALDIHVICSLTEGFSNVLAETMACGIPNITTNCGDASLVVGKTGWLITSKNSNKLASSLMYAMSQLRTQNWKKRCSQARLRISKNFDISKMVESYNKLWKKVYNLN